MRIDSSNVAMESARRYSSTTKSTSSMASYTMMGTMTRKEGYMSFGNLLAGEEDAEGGTGLGKDSLMNLQEKFRPMSGLKRISDRDELEAFNRIKQQCIQYLISLFYPKKKQMADDGDVGNTYGNSTSGGNNSSDSMITTTLTAGSISYSYKEEETTAFSTKGTVVTADGRSIDFGLELTMSRSFEEYYEQNFAIQSVNTCDPLVINLDTNVAGLSDQKFRFDIDGDGILDRVSRLNSGSGYLALDKNGDGVINDGKELFGPQSGNGFRDLAQYDEDGNGWIDENDEIWEKLLIWTQDENGKDQLYHLSEKGVGAICLQNAAGDFSLNSLKDNQTNGIIRSTGIFLYENGNVGTVQHLDVAK